MTVQLKVKGYINGNEWGAIEPHSYLTKEDMLTSDISSLISELNYDPTYYYTLLTTGSNPKLTSVYKDSSMANNILLIGSAGGAYASCYDWNTNTYVGGMSQGLKTGSFVQYENGEFKLCTSWYNSNAIL